MSAAYIKIIGCADGIERAEFDGRYVKSFTPNGHGGCGYLVTTDRIDEAKPYPSKIAALEEWRAQSATHPLRPDGKPNRPLTAFHCEIAEFPEQGEPTS
jgi:hypothetical protein